MSAYYCIKEKKYERTKNSDTKNAETKGIIHTRTFVTSSTYALKIVARKCGMHELLRLRNLIFRTDLIPSSPQNRAKHVHRASTVAIHGILPTRQSSGCVHVTR